MVALQCNSIGDSPAAGAKIVSHKIQGQSMCNSVEGSFENSTVNVNNWSLVELFKCRFGKWLMTPLAIVNSAND